ncbi:DUF397 domain-containing protein [Streptomyces sp. NPDC056161]|uniref:DUF397 domain-containing protein n=1 Tax=Streptomyces sp. NPDC056161 TaxID=3345732 RepID=UPI0035D6A28E
MANRDHWRKSSYSGGGDGNACVEIATRPTHIAIRDSKDPAVGTLALPAEAFTAFITAFRGRATSDNCLTVIPADRY